MSLINSLRVIKRSEPLFFSLWKRCIISEGKRMEEVVREERVYPEQVTAARIDITKVKGAVNSLFVHTGDASGRHQGGKDYVIEASLS